MTDRGESTVSKPSRRWRERRNIVYLKITTDGTTGPQWVERLEKKGFRLTKYAKNILLSPEFKPTSGITMNIAILRGIIFEEDDRTTKKILVEAENRGLMRPNAEAACIIREILTDRETRNLDLWWVAVMHQPVKDMTDISRLLDMYWDNTGRWLDADYDTPDFRWGIKFGFVFIAP
jgi:hypothetical protein